MSDQTLRVRALVDAQFAVVVTVFVVLALAGGWLVYGTYASPGTERVERTASTWGTASEFSHRAVVTEENPLYPVGSNLTNRSVYFASVSPRLEGAYRFSYRASERGELDGRVRLVVVQRGVRAAQNSQNRTVVWERTRELGATSFRALEAGESVGVPFSTNATALAGERRRIERELGRPSDETELYLRATVVANGSVNGNPVERTTTHRLDLAFDGGTYRVAGAGPETESFERTETVARERSYGPLRTAGGPLLLGVGLAGLVGLAVARRRELLALSPAEREYLSYVDDREQFDEWISTIRLPREAFERPEAEASSLGSLVDFAIDTDNGVVASPDEDAYYVVHDGYLFAYRPPDAAGSGDPESAVEQSGATPAGASKTPAEASRTPAEASEGAAEAQEGVDEASNDAPARHPRVDDSDFGLSVVDDVPGTELPSATSEDGSEE